MSKYGASLGGPKTAYQSIPRIRGSNINTITKKKKQMKLSIKQRIRNWLMDEDEQIYSQPVESDRLSSEGMRFQLYKASGGFVIETRHYDERTDRNNNKIYVITENQDLGEELGKIITMESLR